ncbi:bacitracin export ATP-binding protein BceA [Lachnospiraceae bacterium]|nr:ABC transporter ATP-binding protein [Dorea sp.]MDE6938198.1 ABC transporter ATP-binding protein [Lachnospiraceae bacterium]GFI28117.1 bacitracin export ATP-binding protein BceA [Lachnospiraceae bacterium]
MKKILLKTENLSKSFSSGGSLQHVLRNIDLELYQGDFTVIMGASGAGKSTLLYALSGMDTPTLGTITFGERVISNLNQDELAVFRRGHCGFVFQQIYLIDGMSVMDNVMSAGLLVSRDRKAILARAGELFQAVGIPWETQKKFPAQISGGEAQRAGMVRALINSPEILFADEPTGALNSKTGLDVLDTLTRFNEMGQSIVMVTHDMRSARRGNRILYLKDGVILGECDLGKYGAGEPATEEGDTPRGRIPADKAHRADRSSHVPDDTARQEKLSAFLAEMGW